MFFLGIRKWLNERKFLLEITFEPVLKPEAALTGR
jgi:hypothetical protein